MSWIKNALRNWLRSDEIRIDGKPYMPETRHNNVPQVTLIKAMNGTVLQLQHYKQSTKLHGEPTMEVSHYVLKEGDNLPDAVAALLVNYKLDQR
jgi:hypothetical protein